MNEVKSIICTDILILAACVDFDSLSESIKEKIKSQFCTFDGNELTSANTVCYVRKENDGIFSKGIDYRFEIEYFYTGCECPEGMSMYINLNSEERAFINNLIIETVHYSLDHIDDIRK